MKNVLISSILLMIMTIHGYQKKMKFYAGFAKADVTPPFPSANQGQFEVRICSTAENPMLLNVVAMETRDENGQLDHSVWISFDTSLSSEELQDAISWNVTYLGIDPTHVFISGTHTHDAPFHRRNPMTTTIPYYEGKLAYPAEEAPADCTTPEAYFDLVVKAAVKCVEQAWNNRKPCKVGAGQSKADVAHCRYVVLKNLSTGKNECHMYGWAASRPAQGNQPAYEFIGFTDRDGEELMETIGFWDENDDRGADELAGAL